MKTCPLCDRRVEDDPHKKICVGIRDVIVHGTAKLERVEIYQRLVRAGWFTKTDLVNLCVGMRS